MDRGVVGDDVATGGGRRGRFLVFEGPEGAGKSTQIARLARRLESVDLSPLLSREPGGTPAGDRIRAVVLDPGLRIDPAAEFLLYAAARAQHVSELIEPALAAGRTVLCDRFTGASVAYQGHGRGLDLDWVEAVNTQVTGALRPDLTLLLDLDPELGLRRVAHRGQPDRLEAADLGFHRRVRQGFLAQAEADPDHWLVFDADQTEDALAEALWAAVSVRLGQPASGQPGSGRPQ